jgi:hypothetical protein
MPVCSKLAFLVETHACLLGTCFSSRDTCLCAHRADCVRGTDDGFCQKVISQHKDHSSFLAPKTKGATFGVSHYAGGVWYTVRRPGWQQILDCSLLSTLFGGAR